MHAASASVTEPCSADLESLIFLVPSMPSDSYILHHILPLLQGFLSIERRDLIETSHLGQSIPRSLTLHIISGRGSLYLFPFDARGILSDDMMMNKELICEYSRILLGVIFIAIFFSLFRSVFGFTLGSWAI